MATMQLTLPEHLKAAAEAQAVAAGCESVDEYIASLIEANELPPIERQLETELLKGLDSGSSMEITSELLANVKRRARS